MSGMGSHKPLSPKQAAGRLNISVEDLPRTESWTRERVRGLRTQRLEWLTRARRVYAVRRGEHAARVRRAADAQSPDAWCLCCAAEFTFTIDSGGLCEVCNEGQCPTCGQSRVWLHG